jgi:hypothetical protein
VKRVRVTRDRRLAREPGALAEDLVPEEYSDWTGIGDTDEFDVRRDSGALGEVKSTATSIDNPGGEVSGRYRLYRGQHEALLEHDREGSGWYFFVLYDVSRRPPVAQLVRKAPADVGRIIGARGGWNQSGHSEIDEEYKLLPDAIFSDVEMPDIS